MLPRRAVAPPPESSARERLGAAALNLFNSKGYAATTVREIVDAAGVTKPVLYYYFKNKEGIFLHVMREGFTTFTELVGQAVAHPGPASERLVDLIDRIYGLAREYTPAVRMMYALYYGPPQGAPHFDFDAHQDDLHEALRRILKSGVASGELRRGDVDEMAWTLTGVLSVAIELHLCHPDKALDRRALARMVRLVLTGLQRPLPHKRKKRSLR